MKKSSVSFQSSHWKVAFHHVENCKVLTSVKTQYFTCAYEVPHFFFLSFFLLLIPFFFLGCLLWMAWPYPVLTRSFANVPQLTLEEKKLDFFSVTLASWDLPARLETADFADLKGKHFCKGKHFMAVCTKSWQQWALQGDYSNVLNLQYKSSDLSINLFNN